MKKVGFGCYKYFFGFKIDLQLTLIPGCDNNSRAISVWPFKEAKINGVTLIIWVKFHKMMQFGIKSKKIDFNFIKKNWISNLFTVNVNSFFTNKLLYCFDVSYFWCLYEFRVHYENFWSLQNFYSNFFNHKNLGYKSSTLSNYFFFFPVYLDE